MGLIDDSPSDFKVTDIGRIPREWGLSSLGEIFEIQQGKSMTPANRLGKSPHPFLRTVNILWGKVNLENVDAMDFTDEELQRLGLRNGDLLVCEGGDTGRTTIWREEISGCGYQNHIHRLRAKNSEIDPLFYQYWMQAALILFGLYRGETIKTTIPNLSKGRLSSFMVPRPSLKEQKSISHVLLMTQQAIDQQEIIIERTKRLRESLLNELLSNGLHQEQTDQTEIGKIPKSWKVVTIEDISSEKLKNGAFIKSPKWGSGIRYLNVADTYGDSILDTSSLQKLVADESTIESYRLKEGDVVFVRSSLKREGVAQTCTLGRVNEPVIYDCHLIKLSPNLRTVNPQFLVEYCRSAVPKNRLVSRSKTLTMTTIPQDGINNFQIALPPLDEQNEIASIAQLLDQKAKNEMKRKDVLSALFRTLLSRLMTGELRVNTLVLGVQHNVA